MSDSDTVAVVRRHNGHYGKEHQKRGLKLEVGTVVVRSAQPERRLPIGSRGMKPKKEAGNDPSFINWGERYDPPRDAILYKAEVSEALSVVRRRSPDFRLHLAEQFAAAVRKHLVRPGVSRCPVEVLARGGYPTNDKAGVFFRAKVGSETFVVPARFFQNVQLQARPKPKHT